jgi:hypothetical protein
MPILTAVLAAGFALIHLLIGRLRFLHAVPRSRWLSMAGGVAVAYIFLHVLPELAAHQERVAETASGRIGLSEDLVYLTALLGLSAFYGLERAVRGSKAAQAREGEEAQADPGTFWLHLGSFAVYNVLIGCLLLHREEAGLLSLLFYFVAMALHFVTNDFGLREDYRERYDRIGRWLLAAAVAIGWLLGLLTTLPAVAGSFLFAFLAGGVVLNVLKEELPEERQSRFWPFGAGAAAYAALLLLAG